MGGDRKLLTQRVEQMSGQFPPIEPYDSGMLNTGDGHQVYWECCGNPAGKPALYLHGGPGSGCSAGQRRFFNPDLYRVVLFDQRGSGRSRPLAGEPEADLGANTTAHLIADIEALREMHGVDRWTILGLSWGTTLGLAYAQAYPRRVNALVLGFVTTTSRREVQWITEDVGRIFPQEWDRFANAVQTTCGTCGWSTPTQPCWPTPTLSFAMARPARGVPGKMPMSRSPRATRQTRVTWTRSSVCASLDWSHTIGGTTPFWRRTNLSARLLD